MLNVINDGNMYVWQEGPNDSYDNIVYPGLSGQQGVNNDFRNRNNIILTLKVFESAFLSYESATFQAIKKATTMIHSKNPIPLLNKNKTNCLCNTRNLFFRSSIKMPPARARISNRICVNTPGNSLSCCDVTIA